MVDGEVTIENLTLNEIASVWRTGDPVEGETVLYVSDNAVEMDTTITTERQVTAYSTSGEAIAWSIVSGSEFVSLENITGGVLLKALAPGKAQMMVVCGNQERTVDITVYKSEPDTDIAFDADGIISGSWIAKETEIVATSPAGDGYILSKESAANFNSSVAFSLDAVAAAFIFRANSDMSQYIMFNYDNNEKVVKMWSHNGEIGRASAPNVNTSSIVLRVEANGSSVKAYINGNLALDVILGENEPKEGYFGLNVYSGEATFKSVVNFSAEYTYGGSGSLTVLGDAKQVITALYNKTLQNTLVDGTFYTSSGRDLVIDAKYFELLPVGTYTFKAIGSAGAYEFVVRVTGVTKTTLQDITIEAGCNAVIYLGNVEVTSVTVNGVQLEDGQYVVRNYTITIDASLLTEEYNEVVISGNTVVVTVV